jgi:hypothetical protein
LKKIIKKSLITIIVIVKIKKEEGIPQYPFSRLLFYFECFAVCFSRCVSFFLRCDVDLLSSTFVAVMPVDTSVNLAKNVFSHLGHLLMKLVVKQKHKSNQVTSLNKDLLVPFTRRGYLRFTTILTHFHYFCKKPYSSDQYAKGISRARNLARYPFAFDNRASVFFIN